MHTIGYYGDSYCVSKDPHSWCVTLARRLGLRITNWGQSGYSHWTTLLELQHKHNTGTLEDVIVICWTEPHRLYHPDKPLSLNSRMITCWNGPGISTTPTFLTDANSFWPIKLA